MNKSDLIKAGFAMFEATKLHRLVQPWTRGQGAILMFHHVRPWVERNYAPNRLLEITPAFLDAVLTRVKALGFEILSLDAALSLLGEPRAKPFVCLTFDDGYKDFTQYALPVLERHKAPFTLYITTGYADRSGRLWWVELEEAIALLPKIEIDVRGQRFAVTTQSDEQKSEAFQALYALLRDGLESDLLAVTGELAARAGLRSHELTDRLCLDWPGVIEIANRPLATIGAHSLTHAMLAKHEVDLVGRELGESRRLLEDRLGREIAHFAYPVGDPTSAGPREFEMAEELGFKSAVTTRPGMLFPEHRAHLTALPRLSINGLWQRLEAIEVLLSGAPFALWNKGRRVSAA